MKPSDLPAPCPNTPALPRFCWSASCWLSLVVLLFCSSCSDDTSPGVDSAKRADSGAADLLAEDLSAADLATQADLRLDAEDPDSSLADSTVVDLTLDVAQSEDSALDVAPIPDLSPDIATVPDSALPDSQPPDSQLPDSQPPDLTPIDNSSCLGATQLEWVNHSAQVADTTAGADNEYGTDISCGTGETLDAGQRYYSVELTAGVEYRVLLESMFYHSRVLIFPACGASAIESACSSAGQTGAISDEIQALQSGGFLFTPQQSGSWIIAVDGTAAKYAGTFTLIVEDWSVLANDSCSKAQAVSLSQGSPVTLTGNTTASDNEFGSEINCGDSEIFSAPQLYYTATLSANTTYTFAFEPTFWGVLYIFRSGTCTATQINADCSSGGVSGTFLTNASPDSFHSTTFTPQTSGDYTIVVDSPHVTEEGHFTLVISW